MFVATAEEMQKLDLLAINQYGIPGLVLMENAGLQVVAVIEDILKVVKGKRITIFAGKGNNGGDGFVVARHLVNRGAEVKVLLFGEAAEIRGDAKVNLEILEKMGQKVLPVNNSNSINIVKLAMVYTDLIVDAIFGTGFKGAVDDHTGKLIDLINEAGKPVVAVDVPSGLEANTGKVQGSCIKAACTVTFALPKAGLLVYPGAKFAGELKVADISLPNSLIEAQKLKTFFLTAPLTKRFLPPRPTEGHKGDFGRVLVMAGSEGMAGAAALTSTAALKSGAGLVTLAVPKSLQELMAVKLTEVMTKALPETERGTFSRDALEDALALAEKADVVALGPGLSLEPATLGLVRDLLPRLKKPAVIDADGLNAIAEDPEVLGQKSSELVLTPHPGEMARLLGIKIEEVQDNRIDVAREFSAKWKVTVVLKGAGTIIAGADGSLFINKTGNPGMASGGSGDVLTGIIAGLMGQGISPAQAAAAAVYLHGCAGDLGAREKGQTSLVAGDILDYLPLVLKKMEEE